jgi:hypothetical protein
MSQIIHSKDFILNKEIFVETITFTDRYILPMKYDYIKSIEIIDSDHMKLFIGGNTILFSDKAVTIVNLLSSKFYKYHSLTLSSKNNIDEFIAKITYQNFDSYAIGPEKLILFDHDERYWNTKQKLIARYGSVQSNVIEDNNTQVNMKNKYSVCKLFDMDCRIKTEPSIKYTKDTYYFEFNLGSDTDCLIKPFEYELHNIGVCMKNKLAIITFPIKILSNVIRKLYVKNIRKIVKYDFYINNKLFEEKFPTLICSHDECTLDISVLEEDISQCLSITVHIEYLVVQNYLQMIAGKNLDEFKKIPL